MMYTKYWPQLQREIAGQPTNTPASAKRSRGHGENQAHKDLHCKHSRESLQGVLVRTLDAVESQRCLIFAMRIDIGISHLTAASRDGQKLINFSD